MQPRPIERAAKAAPPEADETDEDQEPEDELLDPRLCPSLFGDDRTHRDNRAVRKAHLTWLETRGDVVEITHTTDWSRPFYLEFAGVELVETGLTDDGAWTAVVHVEDDAIEDIDCRAGLYEVEPDFSLGKQARVVGVTDGVLLVEFEGDLAYLLTDDAQAPTWQMVWRSGWYFIRRREVTTSKASRSRSRASRNRNRSRNRSRSRNRRSRRR